MSGVDLKVCNGSIYWYENTDTKNRSNNTSLWNGYVQLYKKPRK